MADDNRLILTKQLRRITKDPRLITSSPEIETLADARAILAGARCWVITDGKIGDLTQCIGLAERLELTIEFREVHPRRFFSTFMPWGPIDPRDVPSAAGSPLAPPFPDIAIASGRRAVPYLRHLRSASGGRVFTVFLKDPRAGARIADFLWVPEHDRLRGANVLNTLTGPHRFSLEILAEARNLPAPWAEDGRKLLGVVLGGNSKDYWFSTEDETQLLAQLRQITGAGIRLVVTPSRRTPQGLADAVRRLAEETGGYCWDGKGENPYLALLARTDAILVTSDSTNMVAEAVATGRPVFTFRPSGNSQKIEQHLRGIEALGAIRPFQGQLEDFTYEPIDATATIAIRLARAYALKRLEKV